MLYKKPSTCNRDTWDTCNLLEIVIVANQTAVITIIITTFAVALQLCFAGIVGMAIRYCA